MGKLRLLHLEVTPVFVDDDGENLSVIRGQQFAVASADVPEFSERWAYEFPILQAQHESQKPIE